VTWDNSGCKCRGPIGTEQFWGKIEEVFKELKEAPENKGAGRKKRKICTQKRGKHTPRKAVRKWKNCCGEVGKWASANLEKWLD
jgi:hypothetical protein